jgi:FtsP/CotA-like multicopper oxidase with cupredoxin domain
MAIEPKSGIRIARKKISGMEALWTKMWDPPRESPATPERVAPTNPVPAFMQSQGLGSVSVANTVERSLLHGLTITTWDGLKNLEFMAFRDDDFGNTAVWPGPTLRVPRGVIFHSLSQGQGPPPHTIHWHGIEPTPMNDGVGHCSMEIGQYTYQWQPNFIGTYFYHCHRNTVQHFEFGLYGMLLIEPPDAYDASIPNVAGEVTKNVGGYPRRTAANTSAFPQFPEFVMGDLTFGVGGAFDMGVNDPHAFTVPYDVEALWVLDDRDSVWSDLASDAKAFYPGGVNTADGPGSVAAVTVTPTRPGIDDQFPWGFFHDFNADYWFVTGVPVPAAKGGVGTIDPAAGPPTGGGLPNGEIPAVLNSGVEGMQVAIDAARGQTILVRCLNAAYNSTTVTFPVDAVIIAFDGRPLGVPPFGRYNRAFLLPAGTPIHISTARRFDALLRVPETAAEVEDFAEAKFFETRGQTVRPEADTLLMTARIPVSIRGNV